MEQEESKRDRVGGRKKERRGGGGRGEGRNVLNKGNINYLSLV